MTAWACDLWGTVSKALLSKPDPTCPCSLCRAFIEDRKRKPKGKR